MPPVEQFGPITKWMSDPPPKVPMRPTIQDSRSYDDQNLEILSIDDRVNTLAYSPNIDFLRSQNCFALNFQWPSVIDLPSLTLSLDKSIDMTPFKASAPSGCFIVLVGGKYLKRMASVVRVVDFVTAQLAIKLVSYFAEKTEVMPVVDPNNSPAIVRDFNYKTFCESVYILGSY